MSTHSGWTAFSRRGRGEWMGTLRRATEEIWGVCKSAQFRGGRTHRIASEWRVKGESTPATRAGGWVLSLFLAFLHGHDLH
jgi:hypothetical protein